MIIQPQFGALSLGSMQFLKALRITVSRRGSLTLQPVGRALELAETCRLFSAVTDRLEVESGR